MIRNGRNSYLTLPGLTSLVIRSGATFSEKNLQDEHCGSPYSITVTGALESPSTWPLCGMPLSSELTCETPATFEGGLEPPSPPPDWLITISPTITATAPNPASVRY